MATETVVRSATSAKSDPSRAAAAPRPTLIVRREGWLAPRDVGGTLPRAVEADLAYLQFLAADDDVRIARALVEFTLQVTSRAAGPLRRPPSHSVINRRRRAARLWVNAVLAGDVSQRTIDGLIGSWIPQLAGVGPDPSRAARRIGFRAIEFLRGSFQASIFDAPEANLVRHARALHALETVLGTHAAAVYRVAEA